MWAIPLGYCLFPGFVSFAQLPGGGGGEGLPAFHCGQWPGIQGAVPELKLLDPSYVLSTRQVFIMLSFINLHYISL